MLWKICLIVVCVIVAHLCIIYYGRNVRNINVDPTKINLIIDTDAGADDALAILLALSIPEKVHILAITCTYGNTWINNVQSNVLKILTIANEYHIPVYAGVDKPMLRNYTASDYFGNDGMGDFVFDQTISRSIDANKHAALAMIDLVKRHPGQINIITLGPTTNVALAVSLDVNFSSNVKRFYLMGSSPSRVGFNFALDPHSTTMLLNSLTTKTKLVISSSAVPVNQMLSKDWRINVFGKINSEPVKFMNNAESIVLRKLNYWSAADSIAISTIIWPELIVNSVVARMTSNSCDRNPGSVEFEHAVEKNVELVTAFNITAFADLLLRQLA